MPKRCREPGACRDDAEPAIAPSDGAGRPSGLARVGGRVTGLLPGGIELADAFGTIEVCFAGTGPGAALGLGDLALVRGILDDGRLAEATLLEHSRPVRPPAAAPGDAPRRRRADALRLRAAVVAGIRQFFAERGFLEVDTPVMVPSPGLDLHLDAFAIAGGDVRQPAYLITSPEYQMKRLLCGDLPRIFQLAHCFRRDEQGDLHSPEFLMLEWYRAFSTVEEVMDETEELVRGILAKHALGLPLQVGSSRVDPRLPFERLCVGDAFARWAGMPAPEALALAERDEDRFFRLLVERVEPGLARVGRPVLLCDFPASQASLARLRPGDPRVCERFELYAGGVELCNGFGELTDPVEQRRRFERDRQRRAALGKPVYPVDEGFLAALEEGMPAAAGNALGVDRLVALCAGAGAIADVQAFPAPRRA
ncbi:MAG: EF-P lysine aminoacylase GenX [Deltaproteobacteria bacterium]|nr:EF-P lysine aminoacylase GenX [Deltaproteobacteria bacterium]